MVENGSLIDIEKVLAGTLDQIQRTILQNLGYGSFQSV